MAQMCGIKTPDSNKEIYRWFCSESALSYFFLNEITSILFSDYIFPFDIKKIIMVDYLESQRWLVPRVNLSVQSSVVQNDLGIWTFGCNSFGQGAMGTFERHNSPRLSYHVNNLVPRESIISFCCGGDHTILQTDEGIYGWGYNGSGQIGFGESSHHQPIPVKIDVKDVILYSCGGDHTIFITEPGIFVCGMNNFGQLGLGDTKDRDKPTKLDIETIDDLQSHLDIYYISCGYSTTCLMTKTRIYMCGANDFGQLGLGDYNHRDTFRIFPFNDFVNIVFGGHHTLGLTKNGDLFSWGRNSHGQLGIDNLEPTCYPMKVNLPSPARNIFCGGYHTIVELENSEYYGWGSNHKGQLGLDGYNYKKSPEKLKFSYFEKPKKDSTKHENSGDDAGETNDEKKSHEERQTTTIDFSSEEFTDYEWDMMTQGIKSLSLQVTNQTKKEIEIVPFKISCGRNFTVITSKSGIFSLGENNLSQLGMGSDVSADTRFTNHAQKISLSSTALCCDVHDHDHDYT